MRRTNSWEPQEDAVLLEMFQNHQGYILEKGVAAAKAVSDLGIQERTRDACVSRFYELRRAGKVSLPKSETPKVSAGIPPVMLEHKPESIKHKPFMQFVSRLTEIHMRGESGIGINLKFDDKLKVSEVSCSGCNHLLNGSTVEHFNALITMSKEEFNDYMSLVKQIRGQIDTIQDKGGKLATTL